MLLATTYRQPGEKSDLRKYCLVILSLILFSIAMGIGQTIIPGGDVNGTWTSAGSPYYILGEITIPNSQTLSIEPGVRVIFMGHYKFNVQGRLLAVGTQMDSIRFTAENTQTGWHGIRFNQTPNTNDTTKIIYCSLKYGKANTGSGFDRSGGAIMIMGFDKVLVSSCLFDSNMNSGSGVPEAGPAILVYQASPMITNSTFLHHSGSLGSAIACAFSPSAIISNNVLSKNTGGYVGAIVTYGSGSPTISGNIIFDNLAGTAGGGISVENGASPRIENNIVIHNQAPAGGGVLCYTNTNAVFMNNTIAHNTAINSGGGICCAANSDPILINNILYGNAASTGSQVYLDDVNSDPDFLFSDIQGSREGFGGVGSGTNYSGRYENNIDSDPLFVNVTSDDFHLSDYSPCIGAGRDSVQVRGIWYRVPPLCFYGGPRPNPANSHPDIGACENPLGNPIVGVVEQPGPLPESFASEQNYPNPFNPSTTIKYELPRASHVTLRIYNTLGQEVATLLNEEKPPGTYTVQWSAKGGSASGGDAYNLASGVYFYRLQAGSFVDVKKCILVR